MSNSMNGKVLTARGPVNPSELGAVMMHEHLHSDMFDWEKDEFVDKEKPVTPERKEFLMKEAVPFLKKCRKEGCFTFVEATPAPWRAWPTLYMEISDAADMNIVISTGFYREVEEGTYWVKKPEYAIWSFVRESSVDELADFCRKDILDGIHGTDIRAGAIKVGTSAPELTEAEEKAFRGAARAQKVTGVHITTHCTKLGVETSQLEIFDEEGVDLSRVVIGHTASHLMDDERRKVCMDWMKRGANFLPTNLRMDGEAGPERWQPLVDAIQEVFDAGLGEHLVLGLDCAFASESGDFQYCIIPPPPFLYMFEHTLPEFRKMGLTEQEEKAMMVDNPARILPVQ